MRAALKKLIGMEEAPGYRMSMIPTLQYLQSTPIQRHTPDIAYLNQREHQLVFIYDGMQSHLPDYEKIEAYAKQCWPAFTEAPFSLWHKMEDDSVIPLPYMQEFKRVQTEREFEHFDAHAPIRGQLMRMRTSRLIKLDEDKYNGVQFNRVKVDLSVPYQVFLNTRDRDGIRYLLNKTDKIQHGYRPPTHHHENDESFVIFTRYSQAKAWMYLGQPNYWHDKLDGGFAFKRVQRFKPNNKLLNPYYHFTIQEYDRT